jgi:PAS domain S-box-containing protein
MNPGPERTGRRWLNRLAWAPIPALLAAMAFSWATDSHAAYESPFLLTTLNFVFLTLASLLVAVLVGRSFLAQGTPDLLLLGCGVLSWGVSGTIGSALLMHGVNATVTVHNTLAAVAAFCQLAGVAFFRGPRQRMPMPGLTLALAYVATLAVAWLVSMLTIEGMTPLFFVQGQGGTPIRNLVLGSAVIMFGTTAAVFWQVNRSSPSAFARWYGAAMMLAATGLLGVMIQSVFGSLLGWIGRAAQYLGGVYMLVAAIASVRESGLQGMSLSTALRVSQTKLQTALENLQEAIFIADADGRLTDFNDEFVRYHRFKDREECSKRIEECPKYLEAFFEDGTPAPPELWAMPRALRGEKGSNVQYKLRRKATGETWWGSYNFGPIRDDDGKIVGAVVAGREITDWKNSEDALRASEERYRNLVKFAPAAVYEMDPQGAKFLSVNEAMCDILGYSREELLSIKPADLLDPESRTLFKERVSATLEGERIGETIEYRIRKKDGQWIHVAVNVGALAYTKENPSSVSVIAYDITERKKAEEALRASELRMQQALRVSHSFTFEWNTATDHVLRSGSCEAILGLTGDEACNDTGQRFFQRIHPDDRARFAKILGGLSPSADSYTTEYRVTRGDGSMVDLEEVGHAAFDAGGKLQRLVGVTTDITARKQAEESVRASRTAALNVMEDAVAARRHAEQVAADLARFNRAAVDRELRMVELKKQVNELSGELGRPPRYTVDFSEERARQSDKQ